MASPRRPFVNASIEKKAKKISIVVEYSNMKSETNLKSEISKAISVFKTKASAPKKVK